MVLSFHAVNEESAVSNNISDTQTIKGMKRHDQKDKTCLPVKY